MSFQNPVGHSQKFAKSAAGQINKNVPSPDEILKHYGWRPKNHAQIAKLTGTGTTGVYANMLLYTLQRLLTARAKHKEKGFSWWVCTAKELAADAGLDINKYNRARTHLLKLGLIDTMQGPSPVRARLMNCTKIRIRYENLYADSEKVSNYSYETKLIEIKSLVAKPLTLKTLQRIWELSLPEDKAKDFHGFTATEKEAAKELVKKCKKYSHPLLIPAISSCVSNWGDYALKIGTGTGKFKDPYNPQPLPLVQYLDDVVNYYKDQYEDDNW